MPRLLTGNCRARSAPPHRADTSLCQQGGTADLQARGEGGGQVVAGEPVPVREIPESVAGQGFDDRRAERLGSPGMDDKGTPIGRVASGERDAKWPCRGGERDAG